jgi:HEAT repeat protein
MGVEVTVKDLERFLKSEDIETVKTGIMLADEAGIGDEAMEILCEALEDEYDEVCWDAAWALGEIGDARAIEPLIEALEAGDWTLRWRATEALGAIGEARAVEPLIKALEDEGSDVRNAAASALDKLGWVPETDGQRAAYLIAVDDWESLVEWGEPAVEPLIKRLSDDNESVRESAAEALGKLGEPAVGPLIKTLEDEGYSKVRYEYCHGSRMIDAAEAERYDIIYAAKALEKIGDTRAVEPLIKALGDDDGVVRAAAKEALEKLGHEVK